MEWANRKTDKELWVLMAGLHSLDHLVNEEQVRMVFSSEKAAIDAALEQFAIRQDLGSSSDSDSNSSDDSSDNSNGSDSLKSKQLQLCRQLDKFFARHKKGIFFFVRPAENCL